ncbi:polyphosphate kinase 1 [Methanolobus mangrovi]|uniref:Polyphosphate kinase n=2 Tax=Methanolobus mangrovi TaxID=3072977 RepID=A0AA51UF72_9EURY|nr:polyphosphate kinase 1 [Methanolobus mangrovi]WMW21022.1 polyphosphate kinase 1 [Methanolobus mangrovi]
MNLYEVLNNRIAVFILKYDSILMFLKSRKMSFMSNEVKDYINREISWLSFNERVLQEAKDPGVPLLERLKFLGIFSSNLDEFFSVRVGTLQRMIDAGFKSKVMVGVSPRKVMRQVHNKVLELRDEFDKVFVELTKELEKHDIFIVDETQLDEAQKTFLKTYFQEKVRPRLIPVMLKDIPSFPYLKNQVIYLLIDVRKKWDPNGSKFALIEVPADVLPRFIMLPHCGEKKCVIMLDDVIRFGLDDIFSTFEYDSIGAYTIKLTRDSELDIDDDVTKSFFEKVSESLEERKKGQPVRFVYDRDMPYYLLDFTLKRLKIQKFENLVPGGKYHNAKDFMNFPQVGPDSFFYENKHPLPHKDLLRHKSIFAAIRETDILLHYPYQSFDYFIDLLREAAIDPNVSSIKITLYRVARNSNVINALINAIKNGKSVTVVIELQARFDEESNIYWTQKLEDAGAKIIDGVPGLKVHSKLCHITRNEGNSPVHYSCIGTGNFNESTAKLYCDHMLMTSNPDLTFEVEKVFDFFTHNYKVYDYKHLIIAPLQMRNAFKKHIENEIKNAKEGKPAYIHAKMNSLVDSEMINALYDASKAGVRIKLAIRGICSLVPGVEGFSENIEAISIVDKYLEHSRIFIFCNNEEERYFISSADWMVRNLDRRVEVATPIYGPSLQNELKEYMSLQFLDNTKARIIDEHQNNKYRIGGDRSYRAQDDIYDFLEKQLNNEDA